MGSQGGYSSLIKEALILGNIKNSTDNPPLVTEENTDEVDDEIPILTDEDIDNIVQNMDVKSDIKPDIDNTEIDAIQKHVEESLLFLDHDKAANYVTEKIDQVKKIVWETTESLEKAENGTGISDKNKHENSYITLEPSDTPSLQESDDQSLNQASNTTDIPEKLDEGIEDNLNLGSAKVQVVEQAQNESELVVENADNNLNLEQSSKGETEHEELSPENINNNVDARHTQRIVWEMQTVENQGQPSEKNGEHIISIHNTDNKNLQASRNKVDENVDNVHFEPQNTPSHEIAKASSTLHNETKECSGKIDENADNAQIELQNTPLPEIAETSPLLDCKTNKGSEEMDENVDNAQFEPQNTPLPEIAEAGLPLDNIINDVSEKMEENVGNVQCELQSTPSHETAETNPPLDSAQKEINAEINDESTESQTALSQEKVLESLMVTENVIVISKNIINNDLKYDPKLEERAKIDNNVNLESSDIPFTEVSIQVDPKASANWKQMMDGKMSEHMDNDISLELSQTDFKQEGTETENDKEIDVTNNQNENIDSAGPSHITVKQETGWECPILSDNTQKKTDVEKMDEDKEGSNILESSQFSIKKENTAESSEISDHVKDIEEMEINSKNIENKVNFEKPKIAIKLENVEETSILSELEKGMKDPEATNDSHKKPLEIATKPQNVWESPITSTHAQKETNVPENLVYNSKSAHSGALKAITVQDHSQKGPKKSSECIIYNQNSAHSGSLKVVPMQDDAQDISTTQTQTKKENEKLTYNTNSVHSASLKVVPIRDNATDCPPAKRARVEPKWSTAMENTDYVQPNLSKEQEQVVRKTPSQATHVWSTNEFADDIDNSSPSEISALPEVPDEPASNRPRSSASIPMDLDSDDGDLELYPDNDVHNNAECSSFIEWCTNYDVCKVSPDIDTSPLRFLKHNKGVLRISQLPIYIDKRDVLFIIKKYTKPYGEEIAENVANVYIDVTSHPVYRTAYIKFKKADITVLKAFVLLRKMKLNGKGKNFMVGIDERNKIDWNDADEPIVLKQTAKSAAAQKANKLPPVAPFVNGEIDHTDKECFGLNKEFLARLKIQAPLTNEILVKNLDLNLDDSKLRKIFDVAGTICYMTMALNRSKNSLVAKIEYDHPLEAVQAISMFDQQVLYNRMLSVTMLKHPLPMKQTIPDGFLQIGPGLGPRGSILTGARASVEVGQMRAKLNKEIIKLKKSVFSAYNKCGDALKKHEKLIQNTKQQTTEALQQNPQASIQQNSQNAVQQQNPENAIAALTTVIASSIQNNILGMLGVQPNLLGLMPQNFNNQTPNWSAPNVETHTWIQPNVQPNFCPNIQMQTEQPGLANMQAASNMQLASNMQAASNMQLASNMQAASNIQLASNMQAVSNIQLASNMQPTSNMQFASNAQPALIQQSHGNMQQGYTQPGPSNMQSSNIQTITQYPQGTNLQVGFSNVQTVQTEMNPPLPPTLPVNTNPILYDSNQQKVVPRRFDIPPVVSKPQNLTQPGYNEPVSNVKPVPPPIPTNYALEIQLPATNPGSNPRKSVSRFDIPPVVPKSQNRPQTGYNESAPNVKPVPVPTAKDYTLEIPLPIPKPQNRGQSSNLKTVPLTKTKPKPVGIKFNIPSLQAPAKPVDTGSDLKKELVPPPPVAKTQKQDKAPTTSSKLPAYSKPTTAKTKSPDKELPWINKQIKAMRRNSKSPERSRTHSPRYDKPKDDRRSRERDYSRDKERDAGRDREPERDFKRAATVIFKYLPPSVNTDDLNDKMREIGKLVAAQVNGKGHAVVTFKYTRDAETCIEMYNKAKVDGQTIEVKWAK